MAGYNGYSMSNNAVSAYIDGEKPLSKWTKSDIIATIKREIETGNLELSYDVSILEKMPVATLKKLCLKRSSWHHTSSYYNRTNFYSIDFDYLEEISTEKVKEFAELDKEEKSAESEQKEEKWRCAFLEWSGTRKHPKAKEVIADGIIKGSWFILEDGSRKKTTANGFRFIEKIQ